MTTPQTQWPTTPIPDPVKKLLNDFFILGDTKTDEASQQLGDEIFGPTGGILFNNFRINGGEAITRSQKNFFQGIKARSHIVTKVYAFTEAADDVMLIGIVNWEFDNGKKYEQEFVARFLIEGPHSAKPTMKLYQGWADLSEMQAIMQQ